MILKALYDYYHRSGDNVAPLGLEYKEIGFIIVIDKDGSITNVQARGPKGGELLEKEALRVISKLPKFKPGMQRGKPVKVKYSQPITFKLQ